MPDERHADERVPDERFPKHVRLRTPAEFDRVYSAKVYAADHVLVVNGAASDLPHARLGLSVSRKVGKAVLRNRWKRLIREAFRRTRHRLPPGLDLVVRPKAGAVPVFQDVLRSLPHLAERIGRKLARARRSGEGPERAP